jgi:NAD(P)H-hydrate epimerase
MTATGGPPVSGRGAGGERIVVEAAQVWPADQLPALTAEQMREIDRLMVDELHIDLVQMMENAGRSLAELVLARFAPSTVTVLAGPGGNGGGGMVAARHLANRGIGVAVVLSRPDDLTSVPAHQADVLSRMGIPPLQDPQETDLVVDALVGYSLRGDPHGRTAELIGWANGQRSPVVSLDNPSGLDVTTGRAGDPNVRATATLTLALPKRGLLGAETVGELYLGDISVPPWLYERVGVQRPRAFGRVGVVRLER